MKDKKKKVATRTPKAARTYETLLLRAAELFARHGYDGVALQQIAEVAQMTKGSLYYHFESKRHIYTECVALVVAKAFEGKESPALSGTIEQQLDQYLQWLLTALKGSRLARRLMLHMVIDHDGELQTQLLDGPLGKSLEVFTSLLRRMKLKKDKAVLIYFFYSICLLNDELADVADTWLPNLRSKIGDLKAASYLKEMIKSW